MNYVEKVIKFGDQSLILNNLRVVFWPEQNAIILSDIHIGKSTYFRKHGIPISSKVQTNDLDRLIFLISLYHPDKLIIVGDLFHSGHQDEIALFMSWIEDFPSLEIHLIKGNHDRLSTDKIQRNNIFIYDEQLKITPFVFIHEPKSLQDELSISGHLHPGIRIKHGGRPGITLPCFKMSDSCLILPAFSLFTGLATERNTRNSQYFAFTETSFFEF